MKTIKYEPTLGSHIDDVCQLAVEISKSKQCIVEFDFNGIKINANPSSFADDLVDIFQDKVHEAAEKYRNSPEGKKAEDDSQRDIQAKQAIVDELAEQLHMEHLPLHDIMTWLNDFVPAADRVGVSLDFDKLIDSLEGFGYSRNMHVGADKDQFNSKRIMGEYIIGQVLDCLYSKMPPHPITISFVEKYFNEAH